MTMMPVILCGGKSTRLPHKLMLCDHRGQWIVKRLIKQVIGSLGRAPILLHGKAFNEGVYNLCQDPKLKYKVLHRVESIKCQGIPEALLDIMNDCVPYGYTHIAVFCADNVYGVETMNSIGLAQLPANVSLAVTAPMTNGNDQLDYWRGHWKERDNEPGTKESLRSPWILSVAKASTLDEISNTVPELLNDLACQPWRITDAEWADLGTPESVERYYARCSY